MWYSNFKLLYHIVTNKNFKSSQKIYLMIGGTLAYVMPPIDIIPNFIPVVGFIDKEYSQINEYGEIIKLNLNSEQKSIKIELMLKGENESLTIHLEQYKLTEEDSQNFIEVYFVTTSRAWINTVVAS